MSTLAAAPLEVGCDRARVWTLNGDFFGFALTGLARYGIEVTAALGQLIAEHHPLTDGLRLRVVSPRAVTAADRIAGMEVTVLPHLKPRLPQIWVQCQLPRHVRGGLLSFGNLAPISVGMQIACIHDVQTFTVPDSYGWAFRAMHRLILPRVGRRVAQVTTVSDASKRQLVEYGIAEASKITVAPNGSCHASGWSSATSTRVRRWPRPFVLGIGRNERHKNTRLLAKMAPYLALRGIDLLLVGDFDRNSAFIAGERQPNNVHLLGRVHDDDLADMLDEALCFLFPSRAEGFGLPAVEAMARGCPVVAASIPALREVCRDAAIFADPDDVEGWARAVARLAEDRDLRRAQISKGRARASAFDWRRTAEIYLELMAAMDGVEVTSPQLAPALGGSS